MQTTIYYKEEDKYLIEELEKKAKRERKSKSAVILTILEKYFSSQKKIGEILKDIGALNHQQLIEALSLQEDKKENSKKIGEILLEKDYIKQSDLDRALNIQKRN